MLSRLKRRTPSSSLVEADFDSAADDYIDQAQQQANGAAPPSPTPSFRSRDKNASASGHLAAASASDNGRTLSPSRAANGRASRSSSFGSFVEKRPSNLLVPEGMNGYRVAGGGSGGGPDNGAANIGKGSLTLDHLDGTSSNGIVRAPELLVVSDGLQSRDSMDSDLRTPVPGQHDTYFYPSPGTTSPNAPSSLASNGTRSRSNTTNGEAPSGLNALASFNSPSGAASLDPNATTSGPVSRSSSRPASRSSSVNSQQYPDSLSLRPPVSGASPASRPTMKKQRSMQGGIAGALAYSGVALASPSANMRQPLALARVPTQGSGTLSTRESLEASEDSRSEYGDGTLVSVDQLGDFDDVVSQLGTGYAVASSKRNAEFHAIFKNIPDDDYLIEDYGCALQREILIQGRLYISEHHLSFNANIFGWVTTLTLPFAEVVSIEKRMTAYVIPNAIQVTTLHARHTFASFLSRDTTYDLIGNIWRMVHPVVPASAALPDSAQHDSDDENDHRNDADGGSLESHDHEDEVQAAAKPKKKRLRGLRRRGDTGASSEGGKGGVVVQGAAGVTGSPRNGTPRGETKVHPVTTDTCPTLKDLKEVAMDSVFPSAPEKIYNLMFTSGFMKDFWSENQKLLELQISDWAPEKSGSNLLARSMSYIKPLNGSIGPKQTKCLITDESAHVDFDDFVCVITTTRTPDVPSGGSFSVKTRTSMTWAKGNSCRVVVTTGVEWTGRSFVKGIIDRSCMDGQKTYHADLEKAMRAYIQQHRSEFLEEGQDVDAQSVADTASLTDGGVGSSARATDAADAAGDVNKKEDGRGGPITTILRAIAGTLSDLVGGLSPTSAGLAFVVLVLVLSNLWTLASRPTSGSSSPGSRSSSRAPPMRHGSDRTPDQVALAVRDVLRDYFNDAAAGSSGGAGSEAEGQEGAAAPKVPLDPRAEAEEIRAVLDGLQERIARLRGALEQVE
ncbi:hypothetical protein BCR35DRAFT_303777 [Leucosporidium creatinivorum]|uniref:VASt domain-containing protein n=1 Tax=Leucosporidium creatinivorum TaxID=106004 RepID=A0A1Y2FEN0_9BASI|nr:hypothetical protein BCR35DRAFT_303777 [Leucosporidium creatinivorum]